MKKLLAIPMDHERIHGLDILRCLAILFVVARHAKDYLPASASQGVSYALLHGVSMFFVLSGFLIGRILSDSFEERPAPLDALASFWTRRWFRTSARGSVCVFADDGVSRQEIILDQPSVDYIRDYSEFKRKVEKR